MLFKFTGQHTNGHTSITYGSTTFVGDEPAEVEDAELTRRLTNHPEFEAVDALDHDADGKKGGAKPDASETATAEDITAALSLLDPEDDAHWTVAGLPAVEAVAGLAEKSVTRSAINAAAPDFARPKKEPADEE